MTFDPFSLASVILATAIILWRLNKMSSTNETAAQGIADLTVLEQKQAADLTALKAGVAVLVANAVPNPDLSAADQAALNALKTAMGADDATIAGIDAMLTPAPIANPGT